MSSQIVSFDRAETPAAKSPRHAESLVRLLRLPLSLMLLGVLAYYVDGPISTWLLDDNNGIPIPIHHVLSMCELFGHGFGVAIWLLTICVLDPAHRRCLPRLITASLGAGIVANGLKLLVVRVRPRRYAFGDAPMETFGSFGDWFPLASGGSGSQSFASSHTATAVGLAVALAWLYPRGRWLFAGFAMLVALQRLDEGFHFLSDVLIGAAVGSLWAGLCTGGWIAGRQFERFEERMPLAEKS